MSLVELPGHDGRIIAVNPHHVSACQPYRGRIAGLHGDQEMTAVWVNNHNIYITAWKITDVMAVLNAAKSAEAEMFMHGYAAGCDAVHNGEATRADMQDQFYRLTGQSISPEINVYEKEKAL